MYTTCAAHHKFLTRTEKNIFMHQMKHFKQDVQCKNEQVDGVNDLNDDEKAFLVPSKIGKVCNETQNLLSDPDSFHLILTMVKSLKMHGYHHICHSHRLIANFHHE